MAQTHTSVLRRFSYQKVGVRKRAGLFHETKGIRYFENAEGYVVAVRPNGAWRHCSPDGKRIGERLKVDDFHGPYKLQMQLTKTHGTSK